MTRVWIFRPDNLGDVVLFSGALKHLRALYPRSEITVCVRRYVVNHLEHCPYVDRIVVWEELIHPLPSWCRFPGKRMLECLLRRLRLAALGTFTAVLLPVRSPSALMHEVAGALRTRERIAIGGDRSNLTEAEAMRAGSLYSACLELNPEQVSASELEVNRDFLRFLGAEVSTSDVWPELWTNERDRSWAAQRIGGFPDEVVLGIAPGVSSDLMKSYPHDALCSAIAGIRSVQIRAVVFGAPQEASACADFARGLRRTSFITTVIDLSGKTSIRQLTEGLRRCHLVLSLDTAALHIATALCKPTVAVMGGGHFGRFYPWGDPEINRVANRFMDCYGCNWQCRHDTVRCIQEIPPETITRELQHLIDGLLNVHPGRRSPADRSLANSEV